METAYFYLTKKGSRLGTGIVMQVNCGKNEEEEVGRSWFLLFAVVLGNLPMLSAGTTLAWTSSAQLKLQGKLGPENNPLDHDLSTSEMSLLTSLLPFGCMAMVFFAGPTSDLLGRKWTLIIGTLTNVASFLLLAFANNIWQMYIVRALNGMCIGVIYVVMPKYSAEISEKHNRGFHGSFLPAATVLGKMSMFLMGPFLSIQLSSVICLIPQVVFLAVFPFLVPESPYILIAKGKKDLAKKSLKKFRPTGEVKEELAEIEASIIESYARKAGFMDVFKTKSLRRRFFTIALLFILQQGSGINNILFYMQTIFEAAESNMSSEYVSIIIGVVQFLSTFLTFPLLDRFGRRATLMLSTCVMGAAKLGLAIFFILKEHDQNVDTISWLPITCLVAFFIGYNLGLGVVPYVLLGELFPPHVQAIVSSSSVFLQSATSSCLALGFPVMTVELGSGITFFFFTGVLVFATVFTYFVVPETKGKSLSEIYTIKPEDTI